MATVATERKNGNGTMARHNGMAKRQWRNEWQQQNGNGMVETRHNFRTYYRENMQIHIMLCDWAVMRMSNVYLDPARTSSNNLT